MYKGRGKLYKSVVIIHKSANKIASDEKQELNHKLEEFSSHIVDEIEEVFENREQIEISKHYERQPKSTIVATEEFLHDKIYYRIAEKKDNNQKENTTERQSNV